MRKLTGNLRVVTTAFPHAEYKWHDIETSPREGTFDVWAKRWIAISDSFEHKRFPDCHWRGTYIGGVPKGWRPTHWCPVIGAPAAQDAPDARGA